MVVGFFTSVFTVFDFVFSNVSDFVSDFVLGRVFGNISDFVLERVFSFGNVFDSF